MEYISRIEKDTYELVIRCEDYKDFQKFQNLIRSGMNGDVENKDFVNKELNEKAKRMEEKINLLKCELAARANETEELKGKQLRFEDLLKEKDRIISELKESQPVKNAESKNGFDIWIPLFAMSLLNSGNHDSYYKGKCDAYESIFMPNKQEYNMQKAREAFEKLKKSIGELNKNDVSK